MKESSLRMSIFIAVGVFFVAAWQSAAARAIELGAPLTEASARQAILKLGQHKKAQIVFTLPKSPNAERTRCWYCDLKNKKCWIHVHDEGSRWSHFMSGRFERDAGGAWTVRITFDQSLLAPSGPLGSSKPP